MKLSVVIPTLNGAANISSLLEHLLSTPGVAEVVVADGGSMDGTVELVRPPVRSVWCEPSRGMQLRAESDGRRIALSPRRRFAPARRGRADSRCYKGGIRGWQLPSALPGRWRPGAVAGDPGTRVPCPGPLLWGLSGLFAQRDVYEDCGGIPWVPILRHNLRPADEEDGTHRLPAGFDVQRRPPLEATAPYAPFCSEPACRPSSPSAQAPGNSRDSIRLTTRDALQQIERRAPRNPLVDAKRARTGIRAPELVVDG